MRLSQLTESSFSEASETKYGIVRYPDTAISYIKNDGNGWEHIFDKSYGFEGPVDKEDLQYAKKIAKEKIPSRMLESSEMMTEAEFDEAAGKKDACYHKVKARYKVWPSAYASGALVKCRKKGAKNWGNKSKKKKSAGGEVTFIEARGFSNMLAGKRKKTKLS